MANKKESIVIVLAKLPDAKIKKMKNPIKKTFVYAVFDSKNTQKGYWHSTQAMAWIQTAKLIKYGVFEFFTP